MCWTLDARDARAARETRKAATAALGAFTNCAETLNAAELIIGELLSNAARHGAGHVCLELSRAGGCAQVSVHDTSPTFALDVCRPVDDYAEGGRGLFLISELARRIDVMPLPGMGKRVSVTLDLPIPRSGLFETCQRPWLRHDTGVCMRPRTSRYFKQEAAHGS